MNLEERYKSSAFNNKKSAYAGQTQFNSDRSDLNIDKIPAKYNVNGALGDGSDRSKLNIDKTPSKYAPK